MRWNAEKLVAGIVPAQPGEMKDNEFMIHPLIIPFYQMMKDSPESWIRMIRLRSICSLCWRFSRSTGRSLRNLKMGFADMDTRMYAHHVVIDETAVVEDGAVIGEHTVIGAYCHLSAGCRIGSHCKIHRNVFVDHDVTIGNRVKIQK